MHLLLTDGHPVGGEEPLELETRLVSSPDCETLGRLLPMSASVSPPGNECCITSSLWALLDQGICESQFEHYPTLGNPRMLFTICGCSCGTSCHWEYLMLGLLRRQCSILLCSSSPVIQMISTPIPWPHLKKPLAQKGHFISCEPVIQS